MTEKSLPKNVFGKCLPVKIVVCLFWGLIALFCFIWAFGWSWDGESSAGWILLLFWLLFLVPILQMFAKKLIIEDDHITIKSWIIFKKAEKNRSLWSCKAWGSQPHYLCTCKSARKFHHCYQRWSDRYHIWSDEGRKNLWRVFKNTRVRARCSEFYTQNQRNNEYQRRQVWLCNVNT